MDKLDSIPWIRRLNLISKRQGSSVATDVQAKRSMQLQDSIPLFYSSSSDSSDSNITEEMFQQFLKQLFKTEKPKDDWFTLKLKQYKEAGILSGPLLKRIEQEDAEIDEEILRNGRQIKHEAWRNKFLNKFECDCSSHLNNWHSLFINRVHSNKWLLECKELNVTRGMTVLEDQHQGVKYIKVPSSETNQWKQKADQVVRYVDFECGFDEKYNLNLGYRQPLQRQIYLAILKSKVIGCIVAEPVNTAYYLEKKVCDVETVDVGSEVKVKCGINRIWVNNGCRRRKVATALFKILKLFFTEDGILNENDFALSTVTDDGLFFAHAVLKSKKIPVYMESPSWKL